MKKNSTKLKFGLLKFCIPIDLDALGSVSNGGTDDRYGLIKELINRGHDVTVFSALTRGTKNNPREERWMLEEKDIENIPEHVRFIKKMKYHPVELPVGENSVDILIVESGVGNTTFTNNHYPDKDSPESGLIRRFSHVINAHKGPVMYMHNDPSLPFYFRQMAGRKYPWGHKKNGYTNPIPANRGEKWVRDSAWGTFDEMFKDKKSIIITRCLPSQFEFMIDTYDMDRCGYKEFKDQLKFEYIPPAYPYELCEGYKYQKNIEYPLFYSGGDRRRRRSFRRYYEDMGVPTFVSGKWKEQAMEAFDGINFLGWLDTRRDLLQQLNKSGCVIQIQPKDASKMGWWTARPMEVPACKSMIFIDGMITNAEDHVFDKWFVVKSKEDAIKKVHSFLNISLKDRISIIETQLAYCRNYFTWKRFADEFLNVCFEYLGKDDRIKIQQNNDLKKFIEEQKNDKDIINLILDPSGDVEEIFPYIKKEVIKEDEKIQKVVEENNQEKSGKENVVHKIQKYLKKIIKLLPKLIKEK